MLTVDVLLSCKCIKVIEIEGVVFAPKVGSTHECEDHGSQTIKKVGIPYSSGSTKTSISPGQVDIDGKEA